MKLDEGEYLEHYGILRKSGRYPWGSGETPHQRSRTFLDIINQHKRDGLSDAQIAKLYSTPEEPFTSTQLKAARARSVNIQKQDQVRTAQKLKDKGMGYSAIARQMDLNESTVRSLLAPGRQDRLDQLQATADMLKREADEKTYVDVGAQVHRDLPIGDNPETRMGISKDKFNNALAMLEEEGYSVVPVRIPQVGTGEFTRYKVLVPPGVTQRDAFLNRHKIQTITKASTDGGRTFDKDLELVPPLNISSKRVGVRYKEDGGADEDGVIYVRRGVKDVEIGKSQYGQVRIAVDGTHYLKGMAIYKDDLPKGVDLMFNTNKSKVDAPNKLDVMKPMKTDDPKNPFGASIKPGGQIKDKDGNAASVMNLINEEGDWGNWSRTLSRQVLSKQSPDLAKTQLKLEHDNRREELEKILGLTNPTIKRKLLESFADETDSAAVHLKAASMPGQATRVILPVTSMKPTEVFAPTFENGTRVALIRFPHAGRFEIPDLVVNNRNREGRSLFGLGQGGRAPDAIGIHPKVAERLSGADFDGDSVVVIPNNRGLIQHTPALEGLKNFDTRQYQVPDADHGGYTTMTEKQKQPQMGKITNLISDMTVRGASTEELARAVRHSMVVIDAPKHNLDYKASERDNEIVALKRRYQGVSETGQPRGASTLITLATSRADVPNRKAPTKKDLEGRPDAEFIVRGIDRRTGQRVWVPTDEHTVRFTTPEGRKVSRPFRSKEAAEEFVRMQQPDGKVVQKTFRSKKLAETDDAFELVSDQNTRIENVYAEHSNRLKGMANEARKELVTTQPLKYDPSAKKVYAVEVAELDKQLDRALRNAPRERQAQVMANLIVAQRRQANPGMEPDELKKIRGQALNEARIRTGANKTRIDITPSQWQAIQQGAISDSKLRDILNNTDVDKIRELATPLVRPVMSPTRTLRAKQMLDSGATLAEVSEALGVSPSTIQSSMEEVK